MTSQPTPATMRPVSGTSEDLELRRQRLFERLRAEVGEDTQVDAPSSPESDIVVSDPPQREDFAVEEADEQASAEVVEPEFGADVPEVHEAHDTEEAEVTVAAETAGVAQEPGEPVQDLVPPPEHSQPQEVEVAPTEIEATTDAAPPASVEEPETGSPTEADTPPKPSKPPLPRILAVANQKGGVGKTTTTVNLGAALAEIGYRVLVIDLDPQGNATTGLGVNGRNLELSIYDVLLHETPMEDCVEPTSLKNLFVVPATIDLAGAEIELVPAFSRELRLRKSLDEIIEDFDFVLIDCPPSLGLLTVNGLAAATEVLVPIQCEYYALEGLGQLLRNVDLVHQNLNPKLHLSTIVMTMFDARTKLADQVVSDVRSHFGEKVCRNIIPRTVRLSEAPSFGQPITMFDPTSRGAIAYRELAKEVSGGAPQRTG